MLNIGSSMALFAVMVNFCELALANADVSLRCEINSSSQRQRDVYEAHAIMRHVLLEESSRCPLRLISSSF